MNTRRYCGEPNPDCDCLLKKRDISINTLQDKVSLLQDKLNNGKVVYGFKATGLEWTIKKWNSDTHKAILIDIEPIEPIKPKCKHRYGWWFRSHKNVERCPDCNEAL